MESNKDKTPLSKPLFAVFIVLLSLCLFGGGLMVSYHGLFVNFNLHTFIEGMMMSGIGSLILIGLYNITLYTESLSYMDDITRQIIQMYKLNNAQAIITPLFNAMNNSPFKKGLEFMSLQELETEKNKAIADNDFELCAKIRDEIDKRKK